MKFELLKNYYSFFLIVVFRKHNCQSIFSMKPPMCTFGHLNPLFTRLKLKKFDIESGRGDMVRQCGQDGTTSARKTNSLLKRHAKTACTCIRMYRMQKGAFWRIWLHTRNSKLPRKIEMTQQRGIKTRKNRLAPTWARTRFFEASSTFYFNGV